MCRWFNSGFCCIGWIKSGTPNTMFMSLYVCSALKHWLQLFTGRAREIHSGFMCPWHWSECCRWNEASFSEYRNAILQFLLSSSSFKSNIKDVGSQSVLQMFVTLSFVYACLDHSLHTFLVVSTCLNLCLLDYLGLQVFDFVNRCVWCSLLVLWGSLRECGLFVFLQRVVFYGCCKFAQ